MNERIRSAEVRLIDQNGDNHGVVATSKALAMAEDADMDLVLISPNQEPPVAKILNYGKYKYELEKKAKEAKKKQHTVDVKEVKVRYIPNNLPEGHPFKGKEGTPFITGKAPSP